MTSAPAERARPYGDHGRLSDAGTTMADERLQVRLTELRREYAAGEGRLRELRQQESTLREIMLRISGAIQVLEELTGYPSDKAARPDAAPAEAAPADAGDSAEPEPQVLTVP